MSKYKRIVVALLMSAVTLFYGCVNEESSDCAAVLTFICEDESNLDILANDVEVIDIFVYDKSDNSLVKHVQHFPAKDGATATIPLYYGEYDIISWGNIDGKTKAQDAYEYDINGQKLSFLLSSLKHNSGLKSIFYGLKRGIKVDGYVKGDVTLVDNAKSVDIIIHGSDVPVECSVKLQNRDFSVDNSLSGELISDVVYGDYNATDKSKTISFTTHRLATLADADSEVTLKAPFFPSGVYTFSLVEMLRKEINKSGNLSDAEIDAILDIRDHFVIDIHGGTDIYGTNYFVIEINDYIVISSTPDI